MPDSRPVELRLNGTNLMAGGIGNSFGYYAANEQYNNDFIKRTFPLDPDGNPWQSVATDHTIRADTSATNDVVLQLSPLYIYQGRTLMLFNDYGPNNFIVNCYPGEFLFDGNSSVTILPGEMVRVTAG